MNKNILLIRESDNSVVREFETEQDMINYFLDENNQEMGKGYLIKKPILDTVGYLG